MPAGIKKFLDEITNTLDCVSINAKIPLCRTKINNAFLKLSSLNLPKEELEVMKITHQTNAYSLDISKNLQI